VLGLGFAIAFGYWTTDFLIIQRAFSARDLRSARMTPIIGSYFKLLLGVAVVGSGMIALVLLNDPSSGFQLLIENGEVKYDSVLPLLIKRYFPTGLIGVGVTSLVAMFMAGQAGNMSAFNTVWTYDIYNSVINKNASKQRLIWVGRVATVVGILLSVLGAYIAKSMPTVIDYLQAISSMFLAPSVAVILLGMFFRRITPHGGFWGMLIGIAGSVTSFVAQKMGWITASAIIPYTTVSSDKAFMAANFWRALWAWLIAASVAILVSFFSKKKPDEELEGIVSSLTKRQKEEDLAYHKKPEFWAGVTIVIFILINIYLW
jgi:SSS family solute:Na+ symporter